MNGTNFQEIQQFRQKWAYLLYFLLTVIFLLFVFAIFQQVVLGKPFGDKPAPDLVLIICALLLLAVVAILYFAKLETVISSSSVKIKFSPFHKNFKEFTWQSIAKTEVIKYKFIGYGIRFIPYGKVYNVSGNNGLSLVLNSGRRILIGTQKPDELSKFLYTIGKAQ